MHDEGKAAVKFIKALRIRKRLLAARFGEVACNLSPDNAEQIEILPIKHPRNRGAFKDYNACQPPKMDKRDHRPRPRFAQQPFGDMACVFVSAASAGANLIKLNHTAARFKPLRGFAACRECGRVNQLPIPPRARDKPTRRIGEQQYTARRLGNIGHRLNDARFKRNRALTGPSERISKAQPFGAVIITVLKQMLGNLDAKPSAQPA